MNGAPTNGSPAAVPASPPVTAADIQALKDALAAQQLEIRALQAQLRSQDQALQHGQSAPLSPTRPAAAEASQSVATVATSLPDRTAGQSNQHAGSSNERIRNLERQIKGIGPISFSGDVRLRAEPFLGGPSDQSLDRVRGRVRARFNATADLGEQFRAGITLASGDINDPTSTNQNLTGFYTRKAFALDQAFVEFRPKQFKPLTLTGGKFRYISAVVSGAVLDECNQLPTRRTRARDHFIYNRLQIVSTISKLRFSFQPPML